MKIKARKKILCEDLKKKINILATKHLTHNKKNDIQQHNFEAK